MSKRVYLRKYFSDMGRKGALVCSPAQKAARAANGAKGGRPRAKPRTGESAG